MRRFLRLIWSAICYPVFDPDLTADDDDTLHDAPPVRRSPCSGCGGTVERDMPGSLCVSCHGELGMGD